MMWREIDHEEPGQFQVGDLKLCDLCGALNLTTNDECFVCSWHGKFDRRPEVVRIAMDLFERRHGRLEAQHFTNPFIYRHSFLRALRAHIRSAFMGARAWLFP